ncbi:Holliday junction resolvase RuvX [Leeia oryzae]|uniref:Holliday junction resolvase RuvX n=1 Tax=Leeia oryzae TaxID=356662 RepID=UPI0003820E6F|nr:Holliday junction resolvase RuvX [Leeia oryzae]
MSQTPFPAPLLPRSDWPIPASGTVLGFDFGEARLGVATGDITMGLATPLQVIADAATDRRFEVIESLIQEWQPVWLVVGRPAYPDGNPHPVAALAEKFGRRLFGRFNLPVSWVDEQYTSSIATRLLHEQQVKSKQHKGKLDQLAAQQILQDFFDHYPPEISRIPESKE